MTRSRGAPETANGPRDREKHGEFRTLRNERESRRERGRGFGTGLPTSMNGLQFNFASAGVRWRDGLADFVRVNEVLVLASFWREK